jgi:hypothetical protein
MLRPQKCFRTGCDSVFGNDSRTPIHFATLITIERLRYACGCVTPEVDIGLLLRPKTSDVSLNRPSEGIARL